MATRPRIGILMSSGPSAVQQACADMDGIDLPGILRPEDFSHHVADLDAVIISNDFYTQDVARLIFTAAPRLRWIQSSSTGYEHLDQLGAPRHLAVTEPGPVYSEIVAEHAVGLLLAFARGVLHMERYRLDRRWGLPAIIDHMISIKDRNLLAIGFGQIGQETARRVRPFGMSVTALVRRQPPPDIAALADRIVMRDQLHAALAVADCVLLGIPLTRDTHRFIDEAEFAAMKPGAILLNMARGPVLNEDAMIAALRSKAARRRRARRVRGRAAHERISPVGHGERDHLAASVGRRRSPWRRAVRRGGAGEYSPVSGRRAVAQPGAGLSRHRAAARRRLSRRRHVRAGEPAPAALHQPPGKLR